MKSFKVETNLAEGLRNLSDPELGRLFRALIEYAITENMPELGGRETGAFLMLAASMTEQIAKSSSRSEINRRNVSKRYLQTATNSTNRNESLQIVTNRTNRSEEEKREKDSPSLPPTPPISNPTKEREEKKERSTLKGTKKERPTEEQIAAYIKEKDLSVDPHEFFTYFTEGNWHDSKGQPVLNWKQKLLTWNKLGLGRKQASSKRATGADAHYEQHLLNDDELSSLFTQL